MSTSAATSRAPIRRRRFIIFFTALIGFLFFFGVPWELPPSLRDAGIDALSRANIARLTKFKSSDLKVDEIFGLLYMVTSDIERDFTQIEDVDPSQPIDLAVYAGGSKLDWSKTVQKLNKQYPVIVFSKTYCPFSRRAKKLLEAYHILPAPKIIEVDLRPDSGVLKTILGRLTKHNTFPNILVRGQSIGGSDDLQDLHAQRLLTQVLEKAGAAVRDDGSGK